MCNFRSHRLTFDFCQCVGAVQILEKVGFDGFADGKPGVGIHSHPAHTDNVGAADPAVFCQHTIRRHILRQNGTPADHCQRTDAAELVNEYIRTQNSPILYYNVSRYRSLIGNSNKIAYLCIVTDVDECHQQSSIAHAGHGIFKGRPVNGHIFADDSVFADGGVTAQTWFEAVILRFGADQCAVIDAGTFADGGVLTHFGVGINVAVIADNAVIFHHCVGTDFHIFADNSPRGNGGSRVDSHYFTTVPAAVSPVRTRSRLPASKKLNTMIGRSCSRQSENAAASITLS